MTLGCGELAINDGRVEGKPAKAMLKPLGVSGEYEVRGLYELRYFGKELRQVYAPFTMVLNAGTTPMAVLCEAAKVHEEKFPGGDHHFFELFEVGDSFIHLGMGS